MIFANVFLILILISTTGSQNVCKPNVHAACGFWANIGECEKNPVFMQRDCKTACDPNCIVSATSCQNEELDEVCETWASGGECDKNPHYMLWKCQKSCHPACGGRLDIDGDDAWHEYLTDHNFADAEAAIAAYDQYLGMKEYVEDYAVEHELNIHPETEEKLFNLIGLLILNFAPDFCPLVGGGEVEQLAGKGDEAFMDYMQSRLFHHPELQAQLEQMYAKMKVFTIEYINAKGVSLSEREIEVVRDVVGGLIARFAPTFCPVVNKTPDTHGDTAWEKYMEGVAFSSPEKEEMIHQLYDDMKSYAVEFSRTHGFKLDARKTKTLSDLVGGLIVTFAPDFCPLVNGKK